MLQIKKILLNYNNKILNFVTMFTSKEIIPLFWWSSKKFEFKKNENFGDIVGPYLIKAICNKEVRFIQPKKRSLKYSFTKVYLTAGSILAHADKNCIIWGSGIIEKSTKVAKATFLAVRGPLTRKVLLKQECNVPEVYGDPAVLLPKFYTSKTTITHKIGIIPHYVDYDKVLSWYKNDANVKVIDLLNDSVEWVIEEICSCEKIISSSLHGIIVAHSYQIPAVWVKFSNNLFGDDLKFYDYFASVKILDLTPHHLNNKLGYTQLIELIDQQGIIIPKDTIDKLQKGLMNVCPF